MPMRDSRIQRAIAELMELLANAKYAEIESLTSGTRMTKEEIATAVAEYGRTIIVPPAEAYELLDTIAIVSASSRTWSVNMPLWTEEEGRSDLTMELTMVERFDGVLAVELDNLHVR